MPTVLERLYDRAPVAVQNLMASVQGYRWARRRYNRQFKRYLSSLMSSQWSSSQEFEQLQTQQLRSLVKEALENVPHYKASLRPFAGRVDGLRLAALADLPFIDKAQIRSALESFLATEIPAPPATSTSGRETS